MKEVNSALNVDDGLKNGHKSPKNEEVIKYQSGNETIIQPLAVKRTRKKLCRSALSAGRRCDRPCGSPDPHPSRKAAERKSQAE